MSDLNLKTLLIFVCQIITFSQAEIVWFEDHNGTSEESIVHYVLS